MTKIIASPNESDRAPKRLFTRKQEAFIEWFCSSEVNCNATEAARQAGYKGNDNTLRSVGTENLSKPAIREEIDRRMEFLMSNAKITVEKILRDLEITRVSALLDRNYSAAVKCSELQGKYLKMFSDRIEHVQTLEDLSTEKLIELIREIIDAGNIDLLGLLANKGPH